MEIRSSPVEVGSDYPIYKALYIPAGCLGYVNHQQYLPLIKLNN